VFSSIIAMAGDGSKAVAAHKGDNLVGEVLTLNAQFKGCQLRFRRAG
jgi:hypothetical protein